MRIHSIAQLKQLPINAAHKAKIEKAMTEATASIAGNPVSTAMARRHASGSPPQEQLLALVTLEHPDHEWVADFKGAVPRRKYELDIALPEYFLAIEVDGYAIHGRNKANFLRDRDKDYLLSLEGWGVLRIQAGLITKSPDEALERVNAFLEAWLPRQKALRVAGLLGGDS